MRSIGSPHLERSRHKIVPLHHARATDDFTEAIDDVIKRLKRAAFGMRVFEHGQIRALRYAGGIN